MMHPKYKMTLTNTTATTTLLTSLTPDQLPDGEVGENVEHDIIHQHVYRRLAWIWLAKVKLSLRKWVTHIAVIPWQADLLLGPPDDHLLSMDEGVAIIQPKQPATRTKLVPLEIGLLFSVISFDISPKINLSFNASAITTTLFKLTNINISTFTAFVYF